MASVHPTRIVVLAKAPVAGRSKTRLTPPYTPDQAAAIARACLRDTLDTIRTLVGSDESFDSMLCLEGEPGSWLPDEIPVIPQCTGGHDARIAYAIEQAAQSPGRPTADAVVLVGMDTPQLTHDLLRAAAQITRSTDGVLAPAQDGGWWLLGLQRRHALRAGDLVTGIPTSTDHTGALQRQRLLDAGLNIGTLPVLRDIDTAADIEAVLHDTSATVRSGQFARLVLGLREEAAA